MLEQADREGLVHSTRNSQDGVDYICNCCSCSCGVMRGVMEYGSLTSVAKSDFYAAVDEESCDGCEACLERCHFNALLMKDGLCAVETARCFGCGLCVSSCPTGALHLVQKSSDEIETPPRTESDWMKRRAHARGLNS